MKIDDIRKLTQDMTLPEGEDPERYLRQRMRLLGYDPENIYQELEMSSRYVDTHRDASWSNAQMQLHSHAFFELLYCINSCGAEYQIGRAHV